MTTQFTKIKLYVNGHFLTMSHAKGYASVRKKNLSQHPENRTVPNKPNKAVVAISH